MFLYQKLIDYSSLRQGFQIPVRYHHLLKAMPGGMPQHGETRYVKGGQKGGQKNEEKTRDIILQLIKDNPSITRKVLAQTVGISPSAIQKHINRLKADGTIVRNGGD